MYLYRNRRILWVAIATAAISAPGAASAYIGPGAGLTAIGTFFALIGAVLLALVGFVWYPIKRVISARRKTKDEPDRPND